MLKIINNGVEFTVASGTEPDKILDGSYTKGDVTYRIISATDDYDKDKWEAREFTTPTLCSSFKSTEIKDEDDNVSLQDIESISSTDDLISYCMRHSSLEEQYLVGLAYVDSKYGSSLLDFREPFRGYRAVCLTPKQML